jgi:hypothetical protein
MRTKVLILVILLVSIISCEKWDLKHDLCAKWKIFGSSGGIHGQGDNYYFDYMYLDKTNNYRFSRNDTIIEEGNFDLIDYHNTSSLGDYAIEFSPNKQIKVGAGHITAQPMIIQIITSDSIRLFDGLIDGFAYYFEKQ